MTTHFFDVEDAVKYGVDQAIVLSNLRYWIAKNKANNKHFYNGRYWTYNSAKAFAELFPYWSIPQIRRILAKLESAGVLLTGDFNTSAYDHTKWYALNEDNGPTKPALRSNEIVTTRSDEIVTTDTDVNTDVNTDSTNPRKRDRDVMFEEFWKTYPKKVGKDAAQRAFEKTKPDQDLTDRMISVIEKQKETDQWRKEGGQFIPNPATWLNQGRWKDVVEDEQPSLLATGI